jgi:hypothetical protein
MMMESGEACCRALRLASLSRACVASSCVQCDEIRRHAHGLEGSCIDSGIVPFSLRRGGGEGLDGWKEGVGGGVRGAEGVGEQLRVSEGAEEIE